MEPSPVLTSPRGFTLAEMVVAVAIIALITIIAITGQEDFNRTLVVTDTAYTIGLTIRQAQTFGLSSRTYSAQPNVGYGVHFDADTQQSYLLFSDVARISPSTPDSWCPTGTAGQPDAKPGNCVFDPTGSEVVQSFSLGRGFTVSRFCGHDNTSALRCSDDALNALDTLDVLFVRPNTNAVVTGTTGGGRVQLRDAHVQIAAPSGGTRYVCVTKVGQISVATSTCP